MTTAYEILATVSLLHDYYADGRCPDFSIVPSASTAAQMRGLGILSRTIGNSLVLLTKMDGINTFVSLPADLRLTFYLQLENPAMLNYSNVPHGYGTACYFTNLHGTSSGADKYLNISVPDYNSSRSYLIGELARSGSDVFEAIKPVGTGGNSHATGDSAYWQKRSQPQYVHSGDQVVLTDGTLTLQTAAASVFDITVFDINTATRAYDVQVHQAQQKFSGNVSSIVVNLQDIPEGRYRLVVNGEEYHIYLSAAASYAQAFGIIELYNNTPSGDSFDLTKNNKPQGFEFLIRFASRLAVWKYIVRYGSAVTSVKNTAAEGTFKQVEGALPKQFVSKVPLPLSQTPVKTLQLLKDNTVLASRLANPPPERISLHTDGEGNKYFCAEMYLNY